MRWRSILSTAFLAMLSAKTFGVTFEVISPQGPVAQQTIEAFVLDAEGASEPVLLKTDSRGRALWNPKASSQQRLAARVIFKGTSYISDVFSSEEKRIQIQVYPSTFSKESLKISEIRLFAVEAEGGLRIEQEFIVMNKGQSTVVVNPAETSAGTFRFRLPSQSHDLQFGMGFSEKEVHLEQNDIILSRPFLPGESRLSLSYALEAKRGRALGDQSWSLPVQSLSLASLRPPPEVDGFEWTALGQKFFQDQWLQTFAISFEKERDSLSIQWKGLSWGFRLTHFLPFIAFALFGGIILVFGRRQRLALLSPRFKKDSLHELQQLEKMRQRQIISDSEYQLRRLQQLEKLVPYYVDSPELPKARSQP